jgi:RNA polymerase sigma-70 factor (ECF subfamily)
LESEDDYDRFILDYYARSMAWVRVRELTWDQGAIQDVVQEAWAAIYNRLGRVKNARAYLFRVLNSKLADERRHRIKHPSASTEELTLVASPDTPENIAILGDILDEIRTRLVAILRAVYELPERQRDAYRLRVTQGMSAREIGGILDCSPQAVDVLISRARSTLTRKFTQEEIQRFEDAAGRSA